MVDVAQVKRYIVVFFVHALLQLASPDFLNPVRQHKIIPKLEQQVVDSCWQYD